MSITKDQILDAVAEMSVMDVVELITMMEEKFGVSAAAAVAVAPGAAAEAAEEKLSSTLFWLLLAVTKLLLSKQFAVRPVWV